IEELDEVEAQGGIVLVMKSTVPVGTGESVRAALDARGLSHVGYVSNPEFLAEGSAVRDFTAPDRVVVGAFRADDLERVSAIYEDIGSPIVATDVASAEMIKLASNAFLATRISFINEIANVCEATGADVVEVSRGMGLDQRLGPHFLRAGIGYGGSCFPKDVSALKQLAGNSGYHFQLLNAVIEVNELQKRRVVGKLQKHLGPLRDRVVTLLGLAFKPNTNDMREASSLVLASRLISEGAVVRGWDPVALEEAGRILTGVALFDDPLEALEGADAAVVVTEWSALAELPLDQAARRMRTRVLIDGRNLFDPAAVRAAGLRGLRLDGGGLVVAISLAGGRAERLGAAAEGRPKALVPIGERPLTAYQVDQLRAVGVTRVVISCALGSAGSFREALADVGVEVAVAEEPEPLGRGGGLRFAARECDRTRALLALNGDELCDIDFRGMLDQHEQTRAAATVAVTHLVSSFGVVELDGTVVTGFREAPQLPYWVNCGMYVLGPEALEKLPERGDHERTTFPQLAEEGKLHAYKHRGVWLTVNTPKQLREAREFIQTRPEWLDPAT
ncbi:MAG: nucleotide sugar dehydrogenase, partial [Gaiellales bacterium]